MSGMALFLLFSLPLVFMYCFSFYLPPDFDCSSASLLLAARFSVSFEVSSYFCVFLFVILSYGDLFLLEDKLILELLPRFEALSAFLGFGETSIILDLNTGIGDIEHLLDFDLVSSITRFSVIGVLVFLVLGSLLSGIPDVSSWKWTEFLEFLDYRD